MTVQLLPPYGLVAEFQSAQELVQAAARARDAGYKRMDAYSPFPIEELTEALGQRPTMLPFIVFMGGLIGGLGVSEVSVFRRLKVGLLATGSELQEPGSSPGEGPTSASGGLRTGLSPGPVRPAPIIFKSCGDNWSRGCRRITSCN